MKYALQTAKSISSTLVIFILVIKQPFGHLRSATIDFLVIVSLRKNTDKDDRIDML